MKFIFLSSKFYETYPAELYPEIERKSGRPYVYAPAVINGIQFAIPMRSHIEHEYVLWTDKKNKCGLDLSKAVVITDAEFVENDLKPHIRQNEFDFLRGKDYIVCRKMSSFIEKYKKAKLKQNIAAYQTLCKYSTLQYFEEYLLNPPQR